MDKLSRDELIEWIEREVAARQEAEKARQEAEIARDVALEAARIAVAAALAAQRNASSKNFSIYAPYLKMSCRVQANAWWRVT